MPRGNEHYPAWKAEHFNSLPKRLYRYLDLKGGVGTLSSQQLWCQCPLRFNDPFDLQWDTLWQLGSSEFREALLEAHCNLVFGDTDLDFVKIPGLRDLYLQWRSQYQSLPHDVRRSIIADLTQPMSDEREPTKRWHEQRERMRVLCLAEANDCLLMWAHYADKHHGLVLEFDPRVLCDRWMVPVFKVNYLEQFPRVYENTTSLAMSHAMAQSELPDAKRLADLTALTKFRNWGYEKEWRFPWLLEKSSTEPDPLKQTFAREALTGVYCGLGVSTEDRTRIRRLLREMYPGSMMYEARKASNRFGIVFS